ncbi:hypothetical protein MMC07_007253 [Pseudocyphellaria aurata]|nr:hypothetical protein [Pseudocyphellaria aurata]
MAPEFVLGFAAGQKVEAKRSVETFREHGHTTWTIRHGFYANMGGFHLKTPDHQRSFPINAKQLLYLVKHEYIEYPAFSDKDVWDKSKADGFQKLFTCIQTGWFIVQCLGRAIQRLPVTTLELSTLCFVFCTLVMYYQWANKPLDVESPTVLSSDTTMEVIIQNAVDRGEDKAAAPYCQTPLDFIDDQSPSWLINVQPHLRFRRGPPERPLPRFTNDRFPVIAASFDAVFFFFVSMTYCSLHFVAWNFEFPTHTEHVLWRASSVMLLSTALVFWMCETYQDGVRLGRWKRWYKRIFPNRAERAYRMRSSNEVRKKEMFVPVWEMVVMIPVTVLYSLARSYIIIEIFLSQRSQPKGVFDTVEWSRFIPHF